MEEVDGEDNDSVEEVDRRPIDVKRQSTVSMSEEPESPMR